jgi:hypothetical protein
MKSYLNRSSTLLQETKMRVPRPGESGRAGERERVRAGETESERRQSETEPERENNSAK